MSQAQPGRHPLGSAPASRDPQPSLDIRGWFRLAGRCLPIALIGSLLGLGVGAYLTTKSAPSYVATSVLLIDTRKVRTLQDAYAFANSDSSSIDIDIASQIELLKSHRIASGVAERVMKHRQALGKDGPSAGTTVARADAKPGLRGTDALEPISLPGTQRHPTSAELAIIEQLRSGLLVRRIPKTMVLEVVYRSRDPAESALIANAFAEAYIEDQEGAQKQAAERATGWLKGQIEELKQQVQTADLAVQQYRGKHGLLQTGGQLLSDHRFADANTQLLALRSEAGKLTSRLARLREIIASGDTNAILADTTSDAQISGLRTQYVNLSRGEREIAGRLGPQHERAVALRRQMEGLQRLMLAEIERIAATYKAELEIVQAREKAMLAEFDRQAQDVKTSNDQQVALRELERRSEALKLQYNQLLQRYQESVQQQSFADRSARIVTEARPPSHRDGPSSLRQILFALVLGGAAGTGLALLREILDGTIRTTEQVRQGLGMSFVRLLPLVSWAAARRGRRAPRPAPEIPPARPTSRTASIYHYVADHAQGHFVNTVEEIKVELDRALAGQPARRIGIVSVLAGEGKSVLATNLAALVARSGARTLLIDGDLRGSDLSRRLAPDAGSGVVEAARQRIPLEELIYTDTDTGLSFLPAGGEGSEVLPADLLASNEMKATFERAGTAYDYVIVDLPAIALCADAHALAPALDAVILVVAWGGTPVALARDILDKEDVLKAKCVGAIINRVNWRKIRRYEAFDSRAAFQRRYGGESI